MRFIRPTYLLALLLIFFAGMADANVQHPNLERGFDPAKLYDFGSLDHVSVFNGSVMVTLPIGQTYHAGGDLSYSFQLIYNLKLWDWRQYNRNPDGSWNSEAFLSQDANAGAGWMLGFGRLVQPCVSGQACSPRNLGNRFLYLSADGGEHPFYRSLNGELGAPNTYFTRDGSFLRLTAGTGGKWLLAFGNGVVHTYSPATNSQTRDGYRLTRMEDAFGNFVAISYFDGSPRKWNISDSTGRNHVVTFTHLPYEQAGADVSTNGRKWLIDKIDLAAFGNDTATYNFIYGSAQLRRPVTHYDIGPLGEYASTSLLTSVGLPDGSKYHMPVSDYHLDRVTGNGWIPGALKRMRLPTMGYLAWTYLPWAFPTGEVLDPGNNQPRGVPEFVRLSNGVHLRRTLNKSGGVEGTWTYTSQLDPPQSAHVPQSEKRTVVQEPGGLVTTHYFAAYPKPGTHPDGTQGIHYGLPFSRAQSSHSGGQGRWLSRSINGSGADDRKVFLKYESDNPVSVINDAYGSYRNLNHRPARELTTYQDGKQKTVDRSLWALGRFGRIQTDSNFSGTTEPARIERTIWSSSQPGPHQPWILDTWTQRWVTEGSYTAGEEACFDGQGFMTRHRVYEKTNNQRGNDDLVRVYTRNGAGNITRETHRGGDNQTVSLGANLCTLALPPIEVDIRHAYSFGKRVRSWYPHDTDYYLLNLEIDRNTGLASASTNTSDIRTTFDYDRLGRQTSAQSNTFHGAKTTRSYLRATGNADATVFVKQVQQGTSNVLTQRRYRFDHLGRLLREAVLLPSGTWSERRRFYYPSGWLKKVLEWSPNASANFGTFYQYDTYGRPTLIHQPDIQTHGTHQTVLTYRGDYRVSRRVWVGTSYSGGNVHETGQTTLETYDHQGRLAQVVEPGSNGLTASYAYDAGSRLRHAKLTDSSNTSQHRWFIYDGRGFLNRETRPESSADIWFENIDTQGRARRVQHRLSGSSTAQRDLQYAYDSHQRLIRVTDVLENGRPLLTYTYADSNSTSNWKKGKITVAERFSYGIHPDSGSAYTLPIREKYTYGGRGGRLSRRITEEGQAGNPIVGFGQSWEYDLLGNVSAIHYPRCLAGTQCQGVGGTRTVRPQYTRGHLTRIPGFADSIQYHGNGMMASIDYPTVTDLRYFVDMGPDHQRRPRNIRATNNNGLNGELGIHHYDGSGNLTRLQPTAGNAPSFFELDGAGSGSEGPGSGGPVSEGPGSGGPGSGGPAPGCPAGQVCDNYYTYDSLSRLKHFNTSGGHWQTYSYDGFGNMIRVEENDPITPSGPRVLNTSKSTNHLNLGVGTPYDVFGNLKSWGAIDFQWDAFDKLAQHRNRNETYVYTPDHERLFTFYKGNPAVKESWTLRDLDGKVLTVLEKSSTGSWTWKKDYVYRGNQLLSAVTNEPAPRNKVYFLNDHLGTARLIAGSDGNIVEAHHYFGFGEEHSDPSSPERLRFTGHERDVHGPPGEYLDYMHARYYSPYLGRFLSTDPINSAKVSNPQSWNKYTYGLNNPLKYVDPDGKAVLLATAAIGALEGAAFQIAINVISGEPTFQNVGRETAVGGALGLTGAGLANVGRKGFQAVRAARLARGTIDSKRLRPIARSLGAAGDDILLKKAVNSNLAHATTQGVERGVFESADAASSALRSLSKKITESGFPEGTLIDTARASRFLVPVGENGLAVYHLARNGTAKLKTILIKR